MATIPNPPEPQFEQQAANDWELERLYKDLESAKQIVASYKRKGLTADEKQRLCGLLCGYSPAEIAQKLVKSTRGVEAYLCDTVYRYVEHLTKRPRNTLKNWRDIPEWLEAAGYKTQLSESVKDEGAIANLKTPVSQGDESDLDTLVEKVRAHPHQRDKIQEQCGRVRILDVEWRVGIDNIYIDVNVLEKLPCNRYLELSDFKRFKPDKDDFDRLGLGNVREPQVPGLEAVARYSKLMLLGKPGSGKTTFLKFLAIQCIRGEFQKERIPIFIELKVFAKDAKQKGEFSLLNYINQELYICDVQAQQVEQLLHQGYVTEIRWREVFLLVFEMLQKSEYTDSLLMSMTKKLAEYASRNNKLEAYLKWISEKYYLVKTEVGNLYKPVVIRSHYFNYIRNIGHSGQAFRGAIKGFGGFFNYLSAELRPQATMEFDFDITGIFGRCSDRANGIYYFRNEGSNLVQDVQEAAYFITDFDKICAKDPTFQLRKSLEKLRDCLPQYNGDIQAYNKWWQDEGITWLKNLHEVINYRNIIMIDARQWSQQEKKPFWQYSEATWFLIESLRGSCSVSPEVRQEIEETLFLPKDELEWRQREGNSTWGS